MRKSAEARDTMEVFAVAGQIAQFDPSVMDNLDADEGLRVIAGARRAPQKILKQKDEVEEIRKAKAQAQTAQMGMAGAQQGAQIAKDALPALAQAADAGLIPGLGAQAGGGQ
jgi:hypothetical protein